MPRSTDNSSYVFNNSFAATPKITTGELFSGTAANTNIVAQAGGMKLNYNTETRYASEDVLPTTLPPFKNQRLCQRKSL
jgi:hypothetical protein